MQLSVLGDVRWSWWYLAPLPVVMAIRAAWRRWAWIPAREKKAVFVTGCDSGFGAALAKSLYRRGVFVYAGCYTQSGAENLRQQTGNTCKTLILDVSDEKSVKAAYQFVLDTLPEGIEFWGLVNNAGVAGQNGPLEFLVKQDFQRTFSVNFFGMVHMSQTFLPLVTRSRGRVVNTCSIISELPGPGSYPYCTSKWAARGFSESLRCEKAVWGVTVSVVQPGGFRTSLCDGPAIIQENMERWEKLDPSIREDYGEEYIKKYAADMRKAWETDSMYSPDVSPVVRAYEHALFARCPQALYYPGSQLIRLIPRFILERIITDSNIPQCLK